MSKSPKNVLEAARPASIYLKSAREGVVAAVVLFATVAVVGLIFPRLLEGESPIFGPAFLLAAILIVPPIEELLFRYLPFALYTRLPNFRFKLVGFALVTSALFSYAHAFNMYYLIFPQFFLGLLCWRAVVRRGYLAAVVLHSTFNATLLLPAAVLG